METSISPIHTVAVFGQNIGDSFRDAMLILDGDLGIVGVNRAYYRKFETTLEEIVGESILSIHDGFWNIPELVALLTSVRATGQAFDAVPVMVGSRATGQRTMRLSGGPVSLTASEPPLLVLVIMEVTVPAVAETIRSDEQAQDRKIALALQRPMLFQPDEDAFSGLKVQTVYAMASDEALVGGDFWDTFAYDHGHVALVVGDVMGHGLTSAIFTTELRHTMRAYIREHEQPARILFQMNQFLYQSNRLFQEGVNTEGNDAPLCIAIAIIARETGAGTLALAGMEPPIIVRADGRTEQSSALGLPLGIVPSEEYHEIDFQLEAGDTLIMTTDGITEARQGRQFLEGSGLMRLAIAGNGGTLKEMADSILNGALDFAGGKLRDDAALVLVRRSSTSPHIAAKGIDP